MYYRINNEPQIDSEIIEPIIIEPQKTPHMELGTLNLLNSPQNKFPLWLLILILIFLGSVGILLFLKINKKYSPQGNKIHSFGYNFY